MDPDISHIKLIHVEKKTGEEKNKQDRDEALKLQAMLFDKIKKFLLEEFMSRSEVGRQVISYTIDTDRVVVVWANGLVSEMKIDLQDWKCV